MPECRPIRVSMLPLTNSPAAHGKCKGYILHAGFCHRVRYCYPYHFINFTVGKNHHRVFTAASGENETTLQSAPAHESPVHDTSSSTIIRFFFCFFSLGPLTLSFPLLFFPRFSPRCIRSASSFVACVPLDRSPTISSGT